MFSRCLPLTQSPGLLNVCNNGDDNITHNYFKESVSEEKGDKRAWLVQWRGGGAVAVALDPGVLSWGHTLGVGMT